MLTGRVIDDCRPEDETDDRVFRQIAPGTHYRVELVTKDASKWFKKFGPDVVEMYSPPALCKRPD